MILPIKLILYADQTMKSDSENAPPRVSNANLLAHLLKRHQGPISYIPQQHNTLINPGNLTQQSLLHSSPLSILSHFVPGQIPSQITFNICSLCLFQNTLSSSAFLINTLINSK